VRRELHEVDASGGEDLAVFFEEEADVGAVGEMRSKAASISQRRSSVVKSLSANMR
jgi:hypothetical protein